MRTTGDVKSRLLVLAVSGFHLLLVAGCSLLPVLNPAGQDAPQPVLSLESLDLPDAEQAARYYLDAWKVDDYGAMYAVLTSLSRAAIREGEFVDHYESIANEAALQALDYEILSVLTRSDTAQVNYRVVLDSILVGEITRDTLMNLSLENGQWRVQWNDTLVLPELQGGNYLLMQRQGYVPSRANIYDRNGFALVAQTDATAIGLFPDQLNPEQAGELFAKLQDLTGLQPETIQAMYANYPQGAGWYLPLGEVSAEKIADQYELLSSFSGLNLNRYRSRYYFEGGIAPHVIGYVSAITAEEVDEYKRKGYQQDERVGRSGLEAWGEPYLAGKRGGALYVFNAQGQPVTRLAEASPQPAQEIVTTLERDFQIAVQQALSVYNGAAVVLERDTGRVLAMASSPGFNPNAFDPVNFNSTTLLAEINNNPDQPLLNRATQGQYPLGSVFKIITMAAALESGFYSAESTYQCGYIFDELPGVELHDWTYDYYLATGRMAPSGLLTLPEGLMRSCNPYFWHIGLDLYNRDLTTAISEMARGFGLGQATGITGLEESPGNLPDPRNVVDAVNMAIGQGDILVTPLQVAAFAAAIGNGGQIYRPQVVEKIALPDGEPQYLFEPDVSAGLPLSAANLKIVQDAMVGVIRNEQPRGTAWHRFTGLDIQVAGKTGTAQSGGEKPHAWFAGYTFENRPDKADIAIAVVMEYIGEGSDYAAPVFRRIVELYFSGQPQTLYWWESAFNVPYASPTPEPSETPAAEATEAP